MLNRVQDPRHGSRQIRRPHIYRYIYIYLRSKGILYQVGMHIVFLKSSGVHVQVATCIVKLGFFSHLHMCGNEFTCCLPEFSGPCLVLWHSTTKQLYLASVTISIALCATYEKENRNVFF